MPAQLLTITTKDRDILHFALQTAIEALVDAPAPKREDLELAHARIEKIRDLKERIV